MTDKKPVSINPKVFVEESLCDLCFEDALKIGFAKSSNLKPSELQETTIRFCVDGLAKWYKSFAKQYREGSMYSMLRDISWQWADFCTSSDTLSKVNKEYFSLLKEITEGTSYTDLAERMDESKKFEKLGRHSRPFPICIPREAHGIINDTGSAIGMPFSQFVQVGYGWSLSHNNRGLYKAWRDDIFQPLFDEVMLRADKRLQVFGEIRVSLWYRRSSANPSERK